MCVCVCVSWGGGGVGREANLRGKCRVSLMWITLPLKFSTNRL